MTRTNDHWAVNYLTYAYLALVFWLPIPLGGRREWALSSIEIWIFILAIVAIWLVTIDKLKLPPAITPAKWVIGLLALNLIWITLQIIPLPHGLIQTISPYAAAAHELTDTIPQFSTLSLDPHTTFGSLRKGVALFTLFLLTLLLVNSRKTLKLLLYALLIGGLFQAFYGVMMVATGVEYAFFIEKPRHSGSASGTFTNRNHMAGYLEMTIAIGIGLMLSMLNSKSATKARAMSRNLIDALLGSKGRIRLALIIMCIGLVMSHSRMGNAAFFTALFIAAAVYLSVCRNIPRSAYQFLISIVILDILIVSSFFGLGKVVDRLEETNVATEYRDEYARDTLAMLKDFPLTGIGSGNFFSTYPSYKGADVPAMYQQHAHIDYLQFPAEQGIPGFLMLASIVLISLFSAVRTLKTSQSGLMKGVCFASFMGMSSILIHSFADFNLQIPANAATFLILLALPFVANTVKR